MATPTQTIRRFIDEFQTANNVAIAEELLAPDFIDHTPFPGFPGGRQGVLALFAALRAAFPDLRAEVVHQIEQGDRVATHKLFHATHLGDFMGIPPTGRTITIDVIDLVRVENGLMKEHWNAVDASGLMKRLTA